WSPPEEIVVQAADGKTDLYGVLYKPYDFDRERKYPVIEYIYGGPQLSDVQRTFMNDYAIYPQALAQLGFVVFVVDGRGTPGRSKAFQDVAHGNLGRHEIVDHMAALMQLAGRRPYMDLGRVGIFGHSYGGYMTLRALLLAPDVYHVGVATSPVVDLYFGNFTEIYMGLPEDNKEGYEYASNLPLADRLQGKLLFIHGTSDFSAVFSGTMKLVEALIQAGKPIDMLVLPERDHRGINVASIIVEKDNRYVGEAIRRYFQEHLKP
ncbi:MAG: S9 family peptidase, partial [Proteobacteria bacterium]|nr:S9 family peptidase [Pseudomonadota bacterium]